MKRIFSLKQEGLLLHIINRREEIQLNRQDLSPEDEFIQVATLNLSKGKTFKPHKHVHCEKITTMAQESWVVIAGRVKVILYDIDDTIIVSEILEPGDVTITFRGGHNYEALEDKTLVYEYKTGPYLGQEKDKVFL